MDNIILSRRWVQGTPVTIDNLTGTAFTGEAQAHTFRISGVDAAGADVQITGTVTGAFLAPNNTTIPLTGTLTDGVAEVTMTSQCYELPGRFIISVYAANGDTNLCIYCGVGYVFCTETDQVAYPSAAIPDISQLIQEAQDVIDSIPEDYSALSAHFPATGKFVVGTNTSAAEENAVAEGEDSVASGLSSHAEGYGSEASGDYSHSEGGSIASGGYSHAEGSASEASGENAHAEGYETTASGDNSHSEGWGATASGMNAHAEGVDTVASGNMSHSEGEGTIANHAAQSVSGTYNVADTSQAAATAKGAYAEIVGNGTADNARSNARTLDWSGNEALAGDLTINKNGANEMTVGEELGNLKSATTSMLPLTITWDANGNGYYIGGDGTIGATTSFHYSNLIPVTQTPGIASFVYSGSSVAMRLHGYDSDGDWVKQIAYNQNTTSDVSFAFDIDDPTIAYMRISCPKTATPTIQQLRFTYENEIAKIATASQLGFDNYTRIVSNTDLNNLTDVGVYYTATTADIATMSNVPVTTSNFVLYVFNAMSSARYFQLAYIFSELPQIYIRGNYNGVWQNWTKTESNYGILPSGDLNTVSTNSIYGINSSNTYTNKPSEITSGFLSTTIYNNNFRMQEIMSLNGQTKLSRLYSNGAWSDWARNNTNASEAARLLDVAYSGSYRLTSVDLNSITTPGAYMVNSASDAIEITHSPTTAVGYKLFVTNAFSAERYYQIAITFATVPDVYIRTNYDNSWQEWVKITDYPHANGVYYSFGDSTTYGQIGGASGRSGYRYPVQISKLLKMTAKEYAVAGQGLIKDWNTIHTDFITNLDMSDANLISIGWAYNDSSYYSSMNFGSYTDTGDTTFIGKYYTIMKEFQQKCPLAQLVLITGYGYPDGQVGPPVVKPTLEEQFTHIRTFADGNKTQGEIYDELEKMANLHGWPCVNQHKGCAFNQFNADQVIGDQIHPTNNGYKLYGNNIAARVSAIYGNINQTI